MVNSGLACIFTRNCPLPSDGNIYNFHACGASQNVTGVCDQAIDALLKQTRAVDDSAQRAALYAQVMDMQAPPERSFLTRRNILYLWHGVNFVALNKKVTGFVAVPDGLLRFQGVKIGPYEEGAVIGSRKHPLPAGKGGR